MNGSYFVFNTTTKEKAEAEMMRMENYQNTDIMMITSKKVKELKAQLLLTRPLYFMIRVIQDQDCGSSEPWSIVL